MINRLFTPERPGGSIRQENLNLNLTVLNQGTPILEVEIGNWLKEFIAFNQYVNVSI